MSETTWAWACEQMVAGRKLWRSAWKGYIHMSSSGGVVWHDSERVYVIRELITATDWELFDKPASEPEANPWRSFEEVLPGVGVKRIECRSPKTSGSVWNRVATATWQSPLDGYEGGYDFLDLHFDEWRPLPYPDPEPQPDANGWFGREVELPSYDNWSPVELKWSDGEYTTASIRPDALGAMAMNNPHVTHWRRLVGPVGAE